MQDTQGDFPMLSTPALEVNDLGLAQCRYLFDIISACICQTQPFQLVHTIIIFQVGVDCVCIVTTVEKR